MRGTNFGSYADTSARKGSGNAGAGKRFAKNAAFFIVLALCFVIVFGVTLIFGNSNAAVEVASADKQYGSVGSSVMGMYGQNGPSGDNFGYPGTVGQKTWKLDEDLSDARFDSSNVHLYFQSGSGTDWNINVSYGSVSIGADWIGKGFALYGAFNYKLSDFLVDLINSHWQVEVKAKVEWSISRTRGDGLGLRLVGWNTPLSGHSIKNNGGEGFFNGSGGSGKQNQDLLTFTSETTLSGGNQYLGFAFMYTGPWQTGIGGGNQSTVTIKSLSFEINLTSYTAPVALKDFSASPYRTDITGNFPVTNTNVNKEYTKYLDGENGNKTGYNLHSPTRTALGQRGGYDYYKTASFTAADQFALGTQNDDGTITLTYYDTLSNGNTSEGFYTGGLERFTVNDKVITESGGVFNDLDTGQPAGYAELTKIRGYNNDAYHFQIKLYFFTNTTANIEVNSKVNAVGSELKKTFNVSGIDTRAPESMTMSSTDNILTADKSLLNALEWYNNAIFTGEVNPFATETQDDSDHTPYIWFYNVKWSADGSFASDYPTYGFNDLNANTAVPFMISTWARFNSFDNLPYDFSTGRMMTTTEGVAPMGVTASEKVSGPGYYRFVFYTMDFAGNVGVPTVYYVRADYILPEHTLNATFGLDKQIDPAFSAPSLPNGTWATDTLRLEIKFSKGENYSGNTLSFTVTDGDADIPYRVLLKNGLIVAIIRDGVRHDINAASAEMDEMTFSYSASGTPGEADASASLYIDFSKGERNSLGINFKEFDFRCAFNVSTGHLTEDDTEYLLKATDRRWTYVVDNKVENLVCVRVDKNKPEIVDIVDVNGEGYFVKVNEESNPQDFPVDYRKWYTDAWSVNSTVTFNDNLLIGYGNDISLYIGMSFMSSAQLNGTLFRNAINDIFASGDLSTLASYFDSLTVIGGDKLAHSLTPGAITHNLDLSNNDDAGLRIFYAWAVDQAGNVGELKIYEILVDANQYTIKVNADNSYFQKAGVELVQSNFETSSNDTLKYRRGDTMQLQMNMHGYIPYALTAYNAAGDSMGDLFRNETTKSTLTAVPNTGYEQFIKATALQTGNVDAEIKIDGKELTRFQGARLVLSYRQLITYGIANNSVQYSGEATEVPISINNNAALGELLYTFYPGASDGTDDHDIIAAPVAVGDYKVKIKLDPSSEHFVAEEKGLTPYYIIPREMTIKAKNTHSVYGQAIIDEGLLKYEVSGLSAADAAKVANGSLNITGSLKLYGIYPTDHNNLRGLSVGTYYVVEDVAFALENYNVTFIGAQHAVNPRVIEVSIEPGQRKVFGASDGEIRFSIADDALVNNDSLTKVFPTGITQGSTIDGRVILSGRDVILREQGEYAGAYPYITAGSRIIVHSNYAVSINASEDDPGFVIEPRRVGITAPTQTIIATAEQMNDPSFESNIRVNYILAQDTDAQYLKFLTGRLALTNKQVDDTDPKFTVYTYTVGLGTMEGAVIDGKGTVTPYLAGDYTFIVKVDKQGGTIVVRMKTDESGSRVLVQKTYGDKWNSSTDAQFDKALFDVSGVDPSYGDNWTIKWDAKLGKTFSGMIPRGVYTVNAERAAFYDTRTGTDVLVEGVTVLVELFTAEFLPAKVYIRPIVDTGRWIPASAGVEAHGFRYYGENDAIYDLDWEIVNADELAQKGFNLDNIKERTQGNFVRGKYVRNARGEYVLSEQGLLYDDAYTGGDKDVIYAAAVGEFFNGGTNFSVVIYTEQRFDENGNPMTDQNGDPIMQTEAEALVSSCRLYVQPKVIDVKGDFYRMILGQSDQLVKGDFVGASKSFDGTTDFKYPADGWNFLDLKTFTTGGTDPQPVLVRVSDDVIFVCDARYDSAAAGMRTILLANPRLEDSHGNAIVNYVLRIENLNANGEIEVNFTLDGRVSINKVESFSVTKNNFTVNKQYDGSANVLKSDITVSGALSSLPMIVESASALPQSNVSSNLSIRQLIMFFEVPDIGDNWVWDSETPHDDVTVEILRNVIVDGRITSGIRVSVSDMPAAIVKRAITPDSFEEFFVIDRQYDGTDKVRIHTVFKPGMLVPGDTDETVGLVFDATVADKNAGAIVKGKITRTAVTLNVYSIKSSNYSVDLKDFDEYGGTVFADKLYLDAEISRVKLSPDFLLSFTEGKQYNGSSALIKGTDYTAGGVFKAESMTPELEAELKHLTYNLGDNFKLYYSDNSLRGDASADKKDANVAFDQNGNVILHDVMANYFEIVFNATMGSDTATKDILKNYVFADADETAPVFEGESTSSVIAAIYFDNAAPLEQKVISAILDNVTVKEKIYDGTRKADVSITLDGIADADKDKVALTITGEFKSADAGEKKDVVVNSDIFSGVKDANGASIPENEKAARNYKLSNRLSATLVAKISPAPLTLTMGLGEKTYDNTPFVNADNIPESARKLEGFKQPDDESKYQVSASKASYTDKNVARDPQTGEIISKDGMAYGLMLVNVYNPDTINYYIRFMTETELTDAAAYGYVADGTKTDADGNVIGYYYKPGEASYCVLTSAYNQDANPETTYGKKIGYYNYSKDNTYYLVYNTNQISDANVHKLASPVNYVPAAGKINPKRVTILADKPAGYTGNAYEKDYDSSRKFHGVYGTDFVIDDNFGGIFASDKDNITVGSDAYTAEFDDTQAGNRYVRITIDVSKLSGSAVGNYDFASSVSEIPARINKIEMIATLGDDEITYGEPKDVYNNVSFRLQGRNDAGELTEGEFVELAAVYFGEFAGLYIPKDKLSTVYPHGKAGATYNIDENGNVTPCTDDSGAYLRLFGSYDFPVGVKTVNSLTQVGTYNYTLTEGSSTNYVFVPKYTNGDHSVITVKKAPLYVYAKGSYSLVYGNSLPTVNLGFAGDAAKTTNGFKNGDGVQSVFGGNNFIRSCYKMYDGTAFSGDALSESFTVPTAPDGVGVYIDISAYTNGGAELTNYELMLADGVTLLHISLPEIPNIRVSGSEANPEETEFTGYDLKNFVFGGLLETDTIKYTLYKKTGVDSDNNPIWAQITDVTDIIDVGEYKISITVDRAIPNDPGNNSYRQFEATSYLTVLPASIKMTADTERLLIDFIAHTFDPGSIRFNSAIKPELLPTIDQIEINYQWLTGAGSIQVNSMLHAGRYAITLRYIGKIIDEEGKREKNSNFKDDQAATIYFYIDPVKIDVTVDPKDTVVMFNGAEETKLAFTYSLSKDYDALDPEVRENLLKHMPSLIVRYIDNGYVNITGTGIYQYVISPTGTAEDFFETDFSLVGNSSGTLSVVTDTVTTDSVNGSFNASLNLSDGSGVIAEKLTYKQIYESNLASASDDAYWRRIAAHMPLISTKDVPASLAAVVKISMTYNNKTVNLTDGKTATLRVALPEGITSLKNMAVYRVNKEGGLTKVDYTLENGYVVYETDFVAPLVFVKLGAEFPIWAIVLISVGAAIAVAGIVTGVVLGVKKKKA